MDISKAITPTRKEDLGLDARYARCVNKAIEMAGQKTISSLVDFNKTTSEAEDSAEADAIRLNVCYLLAAQEEDTWKQNGIKAHLSKGNQNLGFKPYKASRIAVAAELQVRLIQNKSDAAEWVAKLPVQHQAVLSKLDEVGFGKAWADLSQWGTQRVTREQLNELRQKHPRGEERRGGHNRSIAPAQSQPKQQQQQPITGVVCHPSDSEREPGPQVSWDGWSTDTSVDITPEPELKSANITEEEAKTVLEPTQASDLLDSFTRITVAPVESAEASEARETFEEVLGLLDRINMKRYNREPFAPEYLRKIDAALDVMKGHHR